MVNQRENTLDKKYNSNKLFPIIHNTFKMKDTAQIEFSLQTNLIKSFTTIDKQLNIITRTHRPSSHKPVIYSNLDDLDGPAINIVGGR